MKENKVTWVKERSDSCTMPKKIKQDLNEKLIIFLWSTQTSHILSRLWFENWLIGSRYILLTRYLLKCFVDLPLQIGAIYLWSYVYNIVRISSKASTEVVNNVTDSKSSSESPESPMSCTEPLLPLKDAEDDDGDQFALPCTTFDGKAQVSFSIPSHT